MMEYFNKETAEQLTLVAVFKAKPGKRDVLRQALISLIDKTRAEEGSVSYHLYEDREDADRFISMKFGPMRLCGRSICRVNISLIYWLLPVNCSPKNRLFSVGSVLWLRIR